MTETQKVTAPTVNSKEIAHFKYLSTLWWNKDTPLHNLNRLNELRIPWLIEKLVETKVISKDIAKSTKPLEGLYILDVGCGGGFATEALFDLGATVVGIDPCPELIEVAKRRQIENPSLSGITYILGSVEEHSEENSEKYDVVFASEVIDHVDKQDLFLEVCVKCLKPGGSIFVTTFNKTWLSWLIVVVIFEYVTNTIPRGSHEYGKFISPEDVERILKKYDCKTGSVTGFYWNYFMDKWYWTGFLSLSYALHAVKNK